MKRLRMLSIVVIVSLLLSVVPYQALAVENEDIEVPSSSDLVVEGSPIEDKEPGGVSGGSEEEIVDEVVDGSSGTYELSEDTEIIEGVVEDVEDIGVQGELNEEEVASSLSSADESVLSVAVPTNIAFHMDANGNINTVSMEITNTSTVAIQIDSISVEYESDWVLSDYDEEEFRCKKVGSKEFALELQGEGLNAQSGRSRGMGGIAPGESIIVECKAMISPQDIEIENEQVARLVISVSPLDIPQSPAQEVEQSGKVQPQGVQSEEISTDTSLDTSTGVDETPSVSSETPPSVDVKPSPEGGVEGSEDSESLENVESVEGSNDKEKEDNKESKKDAVVEDIEGIENIEPVNSDESTGSQKNENDDEQDSKIQ